MKAYFAKQKLPGVTKVPCFLEARNKYLKTSKQDPFETPDS